MPEDKKDDPAFLYFPSNYRWSMGLLICLSAAPCSRIRNCTSRASLFWWRAIPNELFFRDLLKPKASFSTRRLSQSFRWGGATSNISGGY